MDALLHSAPPETIKVLADVFTMLSIRADQDIDLLRCMPVSSQDRRMVKLAFVIRTHLILEHDLSGELATALAGAYVHSLIFKIASAPRGHPQTD